ncbi:hypothetical protein EGW08_012031 [Elysia chlorotica]|uniref:Ionotropic glutamate receptor C-terminal domain-containing protein n=1 Tax=Elysia chlorotica TaxID=188477 RepID=A0A3S1BGE1_ELYCH|nr:hypothetical protein EGW08_012031 [Elysia chlorotica]
MQNFKKIGVVLNPVEVHNPLYLSLQPSNKHLAQGLVSLLTVNFWFRLTMITQEELRHDGFHRTFRELTEDGKWTIEDEVFISKGASQTILNSTMAMLSGNTSKIFVLHATTSLTRNLFLTARNILPKENRFAWIITENAYTRNEDLLHDFPLGTKAFLVNHDVRSEELLRDTMDLIGEAMPMVEGEEDGYLKDGPGVDSLSHHHHRRRVAEFHGAAPYTFPSSTSSSLSMLSPSSSYKMKTSFSLMHETSASPSRPSSLRHPTTPPPRLKREKPKVRDCWTDRAQALPPHQNIVYSALLKKSIYGLTGLISFDDDGYMNISKFRVRNLVSDGRQSVWQDIGCVQGKEVRPFGIIWPGDAQSLQSQTEGKKRYKVVTNPVQPFVMTEAPHSDYGTCLSDTPCLNLTNKTKSQDTVWEAIEAYENGAGAESGLFTIQCCRGLTIDLLNKLAADLEFQFTLYIVQDETYGQRIDNETWTGIMKDLTDNTAHFAVAAFSITAQREIAIDFSDPYFFSGFSVLYSDKTRETSMLAFLEPFSTEVWFAILVSAHIAAICMALFEWNSPFGLNPWGRKRNKNYSLASGLTMVFSVLFGHTVKTKSPKAWPSKVMQNFWASAAIFIIASYTANLAAFIAGKHAGINYIDVQDTRLQAIKIGVLQGSAVHQMLTNAGSKLGSVAKPVPKTDVGIDWVIKGKLDALLGDYPILDYARAHLAPSCELKLISKIFGDDIYGIGLPKKSPLKAALSKKISEYHRMGYIDDLIDVHFADAHCFKRRISEEDSQLEVTHHAGLFVMMCVGVGVGVLVLLLEHLIYKFLVPYIRNCPRDSRWRSTHLMFLSQRNRLADIAKTKRINRNFHDIVEKARWLQEMKASGLMDDDTPSTPTIIEIPLRQLTVNVELGNSSLKLNCQEDGDSTYTSPVRRPSQLAAALREEMARAKLELQQEKAGKGAEASPAMPPYGAEAIIRGKGDAELNEGSSDESTSAGSGDSLLGISRVASEKSLSNTITYSQDSPVLYVNDDDDSASSSSSTCHREQLRRPSRDRHRRRQQLQQLHHRHSHHHYKPQQHRKAAVTSSSPELDYAPAIHCPDVAGSTMDNSLGKRLRSLSVDHTLPHSPTLLEAPPNNTRRTRNNTLTASPHLPSAFLVNELSSSKTHKHQPVSSALSPLSSAKLNNHKRRHYSTGNSPRPEPLSNGRDFLVSSIQSHPSQGDENDGDVEDVDDFHDEEDDDGIENITVRLNVSPPNMYDTAFRNTPTTFPEAEDSLLQRDRNQMNPFPHHSHFQNPFFSDHIDLLEGEVSSPAGAGASASSNILSSCPTSKAFREIPSDNRHRHNDRSGDDVRLARSLLHKRNSYKEQPSHEAAAEPSVPDLAFSLDSVSKEELLVLWKSSEMDLNRRLEEALVEKSRLERRLAMLQKHSPV